MSEERVELRPPKTFRGFNQIEMSLRNLTRGDNWNEEIFYQVTTALYDNIDKALQRFNDRLATSKLTKKQWWLLVRVLARFGLELKYVSTQGKNFIFDKQTHKLIKIEASCGTLRQLEEEWAALERKLKKLTAKQFLQSSEFSAEAQRIVVKGWR